MRAVIRFVELARKRYATPFPYPSISFDLRGVCAGKAYASRNHVQLNAVLLLENTQRMCEQTVPHEVAHLVTRKLHGAGCRPHGVEWQSVMRAFGVAPKRTHDMDVTRARTQRTHPYKCRCKAHEVGPRMHAAIQRGAVYRCKHCATSLQPAGAEPARALPSSPAPTESSVFTWPARSGAGESSLAPDAPTQRQLLYALSIARKVGHAVPVAALQSRAALSRWISDHSG